MNTVHQPPTRVHASTALPRAAAADFLQRFLADAAAARTRHGHALDEIALSNVRRVAQALHGVHVRPRAHPDEEGAERPRKKVRAEPVPEGEDVVPVEEGVELPRRGGEEVEVEVRERRGGAGAEEAEGAEKGRRKDDKKARRKEDKAKRERERRKKREADEGAQESE